MTPDPQKLSFRLEDLAQSYWFLDLEGDGAAIIGPAYDGQLVPDRKLYEQALVFMTNVLKRQVKSGLRGRAVARQIIGYLHEILASWDP